MPTGFQVSAADGPLAIAPRPLLPKGVMKPLAKAMKAWPIVVVEGCIGGASQAPVPVGPVLVPRPHAQLASAVEAMLWPMPEAQPAPLRWAYQLLVWPEPVSRADDAELVPSFVGHWPAEAVGLAVGFDDPSLVAELLLDSARRHWAEAKTGLSILEPGQWIFRNEIGCDSALLTESSDGGRRLLRTPAS